MHKIKGGSSTAQWRFKGEHEGEKSVQMAIFPEGHGLERLFPVLFDKDEQLQWSNFKGSMYSLFIRSP